MASPRRTGWLVAALALVGVLLWWLLREGGDAGDGPDDGDASDRTSLTGGRRAVGAGEDEADDSSSRLAWRSGRASIAGTVREKGGGPLAGAQVCAHLVDEDTPSELRREPKCTTTDASGRYRIRDVPAATHQVHASAAQHIPAAWIDEHDRPAIALSPGEERLGIDVEA